MDDEKLRVIVGSLLTEAQWGLPLRLILGFVGFLLIVCGGCQI